MQLFFPINKKIIDNNVNKDFIKNNEDYFLVSDKLRKFGFNLARISGLSIGLDDFKESFQKKLYFNNKEKTLIALKIKWNLGLFSTNEYYVSSLNLWSSTFESLKDIAVSAHENHKFFNILNLMIISGARGDWNQFLQMAEFRGLLLNQEGKLLGVPVKNNFKKGLSLLDFSVSSYSARKGIIDTAQKTATAGFLTRRLIFLTQNSIIKIKDCFSLKKISLNILPNIFNYSNKKNLKPFLYYKKKHLRSVLICNINFHVCQLCYGFNNQNKRLTALGSPVGVLAAHSISEPTTQMTLKTFHSGGAISENEILDYQIQNSSGNIFFPKKIKGSINIANSGNSNLYLYKKYKITKINWIGKKTHFNILKNYSTLLKPFFVEGNLLISSKQIIGLPFYKSFKKCFPEYEGEANFKSIVIKKDFSINFLLKTANICVFEEGYIEIKKSLLKILYIDTINSFLKSFFLDYYFNDNKLIYTLRLNKLKFKKLLDSNVFESNNFLNFNNTLKKSAIRFYDNFTAVNLTNNLLDSLKYLKKIKKNYYIISILFFLKDLDFKIKNVIKIEEHTILKKQVGDVLLLDNLFGYSVNADNRDSDIVNAVDQIESVLNIQDLINYSNIFSPLIDLNEKKKILKSINNNISQICLNLKSLIEYIFNYQERRYGNLKGLNIAVHKLQTIMSNTLISIYHSYDTSVFAHHFDLIIKKLTSFFILKNYLAEDNIFYIFKEEKYVNLQKPLKFVFNNQIIKKNSFFSNFIYFTLKNNNIDPYKNKFWTIKKVKEYSKRNVKLFNTFYLTYDKIELIKKKFNLPFNFSIIDENNFVSLTNQFFEKELKNSDRNQFSAVALYSNIDWFNSLRETVLTGNNNLLGSRISKFKDSFNSIFYFKNKLN